MVVDVADARRSRRTCRTPWLPTPLNRRSLPGPLAPVVARPRGAVPPPTGVEPRFHTRELKTKACLHPVDDVLVVVATASTHPSVAGQVSYGEAREPPASDRRCAPTQANLYCSRRPTMDEPVRRHLARVAARPRCRAHRRPRGLWSPTARRRGRSSHHPPPPAALRVEANVESNGQPQSIQPAVAGPRRPDPAKQTSRSRQLGSAGPASARRTAPVPPSETQAGPARWTGLSTGIAAGLGVPGTRPASRTTPRAPATRRGSCIHRTLPAALGLAWGRLHARSLWCREEVPSSHADPRGGGRGRTGARPRDGRVMARCTSWTDARRGLAEAGGRVDAGRVRAGVGARADRAGGERGIT